MSAPRLLVTGAGGFVGRTLAQRLASHERFRGASLTLVDRELIDPPAGAIAIEGDIADMAVVERAMAAEPDVVFHLAAVPGGAAEADPGLSRRVNLEATLDLIKAASAQRRPPRFVYASSIAVFGAPLPSRVDDATPPRPTLVYGAHKLMAETALAQAVRRARLEGVALRLPGIVARPRSARGFKSAFLSDLFWAVRQNEAIEVPVDQEGTTWLMSARCCADNLIHAALVPFVEDDPVAITLPALRVAIGELVQAVADAVGTDASVARYMPDREIEAQFASYPPLVTAAAERLGFRSDGDIRRLVANVFAEGGSHLATEDRQ